MDKNKKREIASTLDARGVSKKEFFDALNRAGNDLDDDQIETLIQSLVGTAPIRVEREDLPMTNGINFSIFGRPIIAQNAIDDMGAVSRLPDVRAMALMPDAHRVKENHVPVGGVVQTDHTIYPSIVGADIACSVLYTETNVSGSVLGSDAVKRVAYILRHSLSFGLETSLADQKARDEFFDQYGSITVRTNLGREIAANVRKQAAAQLATCGDGNHFFEVGISHNGSLALLSHFGSRGVGATVAKAFIAAAQERYNMPRGYEDAPLDMESDLGQDYFNLMTFAGDFSRRGHLLTHEMVINAINDALGLNAGVSDRVYSRHNYAEIEDGYITHRKGATPAADGQIGVIPSTMIHRTALVSGLGDHASINSASHGGGRVMSRGQAIQQLGKDNTAEYASRYGVTLIGAGADEDPRAYKDIAEVMKYQNTCVNQIGYFKPVVVRMADPRFNFRKRK